MKLEKLTEDLKAIYFQILNEEKKANDYLTKVHPEYKLSSVNLLRYLLLRSYDLRKYHNNLSDIGISSIRTAEGYVLSNLHNVIQLLHLTQGIVWNVPQPPLLIGYKKSTKLLRKHANELFKETRKKHASEIMVTLPIEAAADKGLVHDLVVAGMEIARINLSHGDLILWQKMVDNVKAVSSELNQHVKIYMDLSGPKIRTSKIFIQEAEGKLKESIKLQTGDHLILTKRKTKGKQSKYDENNRLIEMAEVGVLLPEIIDDLKIDDVVYFDDGMIKARVVSKNESEVEITIIAAYKSKLSSSKGINLPDTQVKASFTHSKGYRGASFCLC